MLLQHFTWQQFLIAATILTAVWYITVILLFYRQKLKDILNGKQQPNPTRERLKHVWEDDYDEEPETENDDLIGEAALPEGMSKVSMSMFGFAPRIDEPEVNAPASNEAAQEDVNSEAEALPDDEGVGRERQQRLVPDVLEELKRIFYILDRDKGGKEHFLSLFSLVKNKYAALRDTPSARALNEFIRENALFPISDEELTNLWK